MNPPPPLTSIQWQRAISCASSESENKKKKKREEKKMQKKKGDLFSYYRVVFQHDPIPILIV